MNDVCYLSGSMGRYNFLGRNSARDELEAHSVWPLNSFWIELMQHLKKTNDPNAWFNVIWPFEAAKKKNNIHVASIFVFVLNLTASEKHNNSESWLSSAAVFISVTIIFPTQPPAFFVGLAWTFSGLNLFIIFSCSALIASCSRAHSLA